MKSASESSHSFPIGEFGPRFDSFLSSPTDLPTLPAILWEIQAALQSPDNSATEVEMVIEQDPTLAARVLRLANSALYAPLGSLYSIKEAIAHVGRREIERMINTTLVIDVFSPPSGSMEFPAFWTHSLQVAETAALIADENSSTSPLLPAEAYMPGLLHDTGKLLLDQYFPEDYALVRAFKADHACTDDQAERNTIGMGHGEIGARVMELWNVPPNIVEAVRGHHRPDLCEEEHRPAAELIGHADALCHACQAGALPARLLNHPALPLDARATQTLIENIRNAQERVLMLLK